MVNKIAYRSSVCFCRNGITAAAMVLQRCCAPHTHPSPIRRWRPVAVNNGGTCCCQQWGHMLLSTMAALEYMLGGERIARCDQRSQSGVTSFGRARTPQLLQSSPGAASECCCAPYTPPSPMRMGRPVAVNNGGMCAAEQHWKTCSERSSLHIQPTSCALMGLSP